MSGREVHVTLTADITQVLDGVRRARLAVRRMNAKFGHAQRRCDFLNGYHGPHTWERLNPATGKRYRRGRVTFFCKGSAA